MPFEERAQIARQDIEKIGHLPLIKFFQQGAG
jgi:hypothetical protein